MVVASEVNRVNVIAMIGEKILAFCNKKIQTLGQDTFGYVERIFRIVYRIEVYLFAVL